MEDEKKTKWKGIIPICPFLSYVSLRMAKLGKPWNPMHYECHIGMWCYIRIGGGGSEPRKIYSVHTVTSFYVPT